MWSIHSWETTDTSAIALFGISLLRKLVVLGDFSPLLNVLVGNNEDLFDLVLVEDFSIGIRRAGMVDVPSEVALYTAIYNLVVLQWEHLTPALQQLLLNLLTRVRLHLRYYLAKLFDNYFFTAYIVSSKQPDPMDFGLTRNEFVSLVLKKYFIPISQWCIRPVLEIWVWLLLFTAQHKLTFWHRILFLDLQIKPRIWQIQQIVFNDHIFASFIYRAGNSVEIIGLLKYTCDLLVEFTYII